MLNLNKISLVALLFSFVCALGCQDKKPRRPKETPAQAKARKEAAKKARAERKARKAEQYTENMKTLQAIRRGDLAEVELRLDNGCPVDTTNQTSRTLLQHAIAAKQFEIARLLIERGADLNVRSKGRSTAGKQSPLHMCVISNNIEFAKLLLDKGADVNGGEGTHLTPLHLVARTDNQEMAKLLLSAEAKVDARTKGGRTPLHEAATYAKIKVAGLLISKGADVNAKTKRGRTPLHEAVAAYPVDWQTIKFLLANGADPNASTPKGVTPLGLAISGNSKYIEQLLRKKIDGHETAIDTSSEPGQPATCNAETLKKFGFSLKPVKGFTISPVQPNVIPGKTGVTEKYKVPCRKFEDNRECVTRARRKAKKLHPKSNLSLRLVSDDSYWQTRFRINGKIIHKRFASTHEMMKYYGSQRTKGIKIEILGSQEKITQKNRAVQVDVKDRQETEAACLIAETDQDCKDRLLAEAKKANPNGFVSVRIQGEKKSFVALFEIDGKEEKKSFPFQHKIQGYMKKMRRKHKVVLKKVVTEHDPKTRKARVSVTRLAGNKPRFSVRASIRWKPDLGWVEANKFINEKLSEFGAILLSIEPRADGIIALEVGCRD
ncbi:MAG: ankyrin repeat domain-containing protein [Deltaproteobacteria bacterium]|nr:ankyrin repeat domain-containing protein [Deltaproteobacteria bacterium]